METDFTLRLSVIAPKWNEQLHREINSIRTANPDSSRVLLEIEHTKLRAEWYYQTCCEIWEIQGRPKCRPFFRAIFEWCLNPLFATRKSCLEGDFNRRALISRNAVGYSAHLGAFSRAMGKLKAEWNTRLEIATRDAENQERLARERELEQRAQAIRDIRERSFFEEAFGSRQPSPFNSIHSMGEAPLSTGQVGAVVSPFTWKELQVRFRNLQEKTTPQRNLYALFIRKEWHSGAANEEWTVGGANPACQKDFEHLASIAARKLGYAPGEHAYTDWLGRVREWMHQAGLDKDRNMVRRSFGDETLEGHTAETRCLSIEQIAESSAMFCMELMARGTPESAASLPSERSATVSSTVVKSGVHKKAGRPIRRNREFQTLAGKLWLQELNGAHKVSLDGLKRIASKLDTSDFKKPSDHLEKTAAKALKAHNQKYANSEAKKIMNWTALVESGDADHLAAMRKLLSRCARNIRK